MHSRPDTPLLLMAGGTDLAPVLALLEQQVGFAPERDMVLVWGMRSKADFYALPTLQDLIAHTPRLQVILAVEHLPEGEVQTGQLRFIQGSVLDALKRDANLANGRDAYVAGPPVMLREVSRALNALGLDKTRLHIESFGV